MERISSMFFCLSLLVYYILKLFKVKRKVYVKTHIFLGVISVAAMYRFCGYYGCYWSNWSYYEEKLQVI